MARPSDALTVQSVVNCLAIASFGDTYVSVRSGKPTVVVALPIAPFCACHRSRRAPNVARHSSANAHVSCA